MESVLVPPPAKVARLQSPERPHSPNRKPFLEKLAEVVPPSGCWTFPDGDKLEAISFVESFEVLEKHFVSEAVAWVVGAPGCGKTSLGKVFSRHLEQHDWNVTFWTARAITETLVREFRKNKLSGPNVNGKMLVIIDECQAIEDWGIVHDLLIKNRPTKVLLLGTDHPVKGKSDPQYTPEALQNNRFWMFGPTVKRDTIREFLRSALEKLGVPSSELLARWCYSIFDVCGGNLDLVLTSLRLLVRKGDFPTTYHLLKQKPRTVANGEEDWSRTKVELAQRVCAVGATSVAEGCEARDLVRRGFLMPVRLDHADSGLVKAKPGDYMDLTWATALQRDYAVICQKVSPLPTKEVRTAVLQRPLDLLLRLLPMVDVDFLTTCDIAGTGSSSATEHHIQAAVLVAASKVCPKGTFLNDFPVDKSRLDFLYTHDGNRWGFEITRNGSDVNQHMKRFEDGPYKDACSDWLVVDFCTNPSSAPAPIKPNLVRISPHWCVGWDAFTVSSSGQTVHVPRNGVPQHLVIDGSSKWQVKPCVETVETLPGPEVEVWVQSLKQKANQFDEDGDAFVVEGTFTHVDSLKKGIAKVVGKHFKHILVYCQEEGTWQKLNPKAKVIVERTPEITYGFTDTTTTADSD